MQVGGGEVLKLTVPLKPLILFSMMLVKVDEPAGTFCEALGVDRAKFGLTGPISEPF